MQSRLLKGWNALWSWGETELLVTGGGSTRRSRTSREDCRRSSSVETHQNGAGQCSLIVFGVQHEKSPRGSDVFWRHNILPRPTFGSSPSDRPLNKYTIPGKFGSVRTHKGVEREKSLVCWQISQFWFTILSRHADKGEVMSSKPKSSSSTISKNTPATSPGSRRNIMGCRGKRFIGTS
jgi:hypothetical protein